MFTLGATRLTVPAGGTASATVTADTRVDGPDGHYTGRIVARSDGDGGGGHPAGGAPGGGELHGDRPAPEPRRRGSPASTAPRWSRWTSSTRTTCTTRTAPPSCGSPRAGTGWSATCSSVDGDEFTGGHPARPAGAGGRRGHADHPRRPTGQAGQDERPAALGHPGARRHRGQLPRRERQLHLRPAGLRLRRSLHRQGSGKPVPAERFVATVSSQWADLEAASSPYLYALSEAVPGPDADRLRPALPGEGPGHRHPPVQRRQPGAGPERLVFRAPGTRHRRLGGRPAHRDARGSGSSTTTPGACAGPPSWTSGCRPTTAGSTPRRSCSPRSGACAPGGTTGRAGTARRTGRRSRTAGISPPGRPHRGGPAAAQ